MLNILVVEDEYNLRTFLKEALTSRGYNIFLASNGEEGLDTHLSNPIDLIITDVMMPCMDGNTLCKHIREDDKETPIIMLTALGTYPDKEKGYNSGIDHYIVKPVDILELNLVMKALLRRVHKTNQSKIKHKSIVLDYLTKECTVNGNYIKLSIKEFELLYLLLSTPNRTYTRNHIIDNIWGFDSEIFDRTIDTHIKRIRAKTKCKDIQIVTVRGLGYKGVLL